MKKEEKLLRLEDGGIVIEIRVDDENRMFYVVKRGDKITVEPASNQKVAEIYPRNSDSEVTIKNPANQS